MRHKLLTAVSTATLIAVTAGCANDPNRSVQERETERNVITAVAAIGGALAANALGMDSTGGKVIVGAISGVTARHLYGDIKADTANDPNTDVTPVNINGEEFIQVNVKDVNFRSGSAQLDPYELSRLKPVIDALNQYANTRVHIEGHTDSDGSHQYNQQLSENRAKNVALHLMDRGVQRKRIITYGYGEERPIASNETAQGKSMNRRVTFLISEI